MVDEPDENHLQGEKKKTKKTTPQPQPTATTTSNHSNHHTTTKLGLTTQEALKVLSDEIEEVVELYERNLHNER